MHVRHILVEFEYQAEDVLKKLNEGEDFADLATRFSQCGSAKTGGSLGRIKPGQTVETFEEACEELAVGEVSKPVKTRFGVHIIQRLSE